MGLRLLSLYRPRQNLRAPRVWVSQIFYTVGTWRWLRFEPCTQSPLSPRKHPWHSFVLDAVSTPGLLCGHKNYSMNIPHNPIGIRTHDISSWNAVPHPNMPHCAPFKFRTWGLLSYNEESNVNPSPSSIRYQNIKCWYPIYIKIYQCINTGVTLS